MWKYPVVSFRVMVTSTVIAVVLCAAASARQENSGGRDAAATRQAQQNLIDMGYLKDQADGHYGRKTHDAVRDFQHDMKLPETGELDARTQEELQKAVVSGYRKPSSGGIFTKMGKGISKGAVAGAKGVAKGTTTAGKATAKGVTVAGTETAKATTTAGKATAKGVTVAGTETAKATTTAAVKTKEATFGKTAAAESSNDTAASPEQLRQAQVLLSEQGFYKGPSDGQAGPATREALRQFQIKHNLPVTGQLDEASRKALGMP